MSVTCPFADIDKLDSQTRMEDILMQTPSYAGRDVRNAFRSISFNGRNTKLATMKSFGSGKMILQGSLTFKEKEFETMISFKSPFSDKANKQFVSSTSFKSGDTNNNLPRSDSSSEINASMQEPSNQRNQAALRLQKVYKSFRTRRQLADCAVIVEQKWWKLLDFAELKRSSISFFNIEKPETAVSRWARARTRAAKVGKGLSKDEKARKLALQHWLEAIDPRHRYGHNLQFYYVKWLHCESKQPFFYWLDIGEGKEVNMDRCSRSKLQQQCIKYLGPVEREMYEVVLENGKFVNKQSWEFLNTTGPKDAKWIFVLSTSKTLYVGQKNKGKFQHSSFLAGGATLAAGRLDVEDGILKAVWPHSGHYLPTEENFQAFISFLIENNVDLSDVKKSPTDGDEEVSRMGKCISLQGELSEANLSQDREAFFRSSSQGNVDLENNDSNAVEIPNPSMSRLSRGFGSKLTQLEIPNRDDMFDNLKTDILIPLPSCKYIPPGSPSEEGYETAEESFLSEEDFMVPKLNLFSEDEDELEEPIPKEKILQRIDSHKQMKSYQLAQQLSSKWSTGAGPRIGCMRDYPPELQFRVLEQANLSPRERSAQPSPRTLSRFSPREPIPSSLRRESSTERSSLAPKLIEQS